MEYRRLGNSGLTVRVLSFGTATFGGVNEREKTIPQESFPMLLPTFPSMAQ